MTFIPGLFLTSFMWVLTWTLRAGAWKKEMALLPNMQPAVLNLLLQVWEQPPHVLDTTWDSPNSRPLPSDLSIFLLVRASVPIFGFQKNGPIVKSSLANK